MNSGFVNDPQSERGNACSRTVSGLVDYSELQVREGPFSTSRGLELKYRGTRGKFDTIHLCLIHRYLFQEFFPPAGEFHVVDISKDDTNTETAMPIASALMEWYERLAKEKLLDRLGAAQFVARAALYLGEINAVHPFREGNGRTQREFIQQLALQAGHLLSWSLVGTGFTNQQMIGPSILSPTCGDNSQLAAILDGALFSSQERT